MSWGAVIAGGAAIVGGALSNKGSKDAAKTQAESAEKSSQIQWDIYDQTREDLDPYKKAGKTSLDQLMAMMKPNGSLMQTFKGQDIYKDPSYQFRLNQGTNAIQSGAAAQGGLLSGATQKALLDYGQQAASQEFGNAYNRFNADQTNQYNRLSNLIGIGQNAAAQVGNAGAQTGQAVANNTMQGANALAAGQVAGSNAWADAFGTVGSLAAAYANNRNKTGVV